LSGFLSLFNVEAVKYWLLQHLTVHKITYCCRLCTCLCS